jgi:hypothetical protein
MEIVDKDGAVLVPPITVPIFEQLDFRKWLV